jgi:imidazole glycerol-phosphate synthase subunit HisH
MSPKMTIIDYGMGNLNSVKKAFSRIGVEAIITSNYLDVINSEKLVLPGVGHFQKAVENLKKSGIWDALNIAVLEKKVPIIGICLGMQLMAKFSEEGNVSGLSWFDASVVKFRVNDTLKYKIPHIGWNQVTLKKSSQLFINVDLIPGFYFVHSYHVNCHSEEDILNETLYEDYFVSGIQKDNIWGVQYHPEKSHDAGEQLLRNFVAL